MDLKLYLGSVGYRLTAVALTALAIVGAAAASSGGKPTLGFAGAGVALLVAWLAEAQGKVVAARGRHR